MTYEEATVRAVLRVTQKLPFEDRVRRALQVGLNPVELSLLHRHVRLGFMPLFQLGRLKTGYIP
jgi:hypothetical protein